MEISNIDGAKKAFRHPKLAVMYPSNNQAIVLPTRKHDPNAPPTVPNPDLNQLLIILTTEGHPVDWAYPFMPHIITNNMKSSV